MNSRERELTFVEHLLCTFMYTISWILTTVIIRLLPTFMNKALAFHKGNWLAQGHAAPMTVLSVQHTTGICHLPPLPSHPSPHPHPYTLFHSLLFSVIILNQPNLGLFLEGETKTQILLSAHVFKGDPGGSPRHACPYYLWSWAKSRNGGAHTIWLNNSNKFLCSIFRPSQYTFIMLWKARFELRILRLLRALHQNRGVGTSPCFEGFCIHT